MTTPDSGQSAAAGTQSGAEGTQGTQGTAGATAPESTPAGQSAGTTTTTPPEAEATVLRKDFDAIRNQLSQADKAREEAQNALKQLRDKDLPEMDKLKRDIAEAEAKAAEATKALEATRIENAFLTHADEKIKWKNPTTALKLLDRAKITIDSAGAVIGMKDAIEALAKSDPYLLEDKTATPAEETPVGGTIPGNNGRGTAQPDANKMATRFPALRTRRTS
jgi:hypothetical protein